MVVTGFVNWNFKNDYQLLSYLQCLLEIWRKPPSCDVRVHAYKNGKTMEQCREEARKNTEILSHEILEKGEVSWTRVLEAADHDELVYKLTLKYLRQGGHDIGNNKIPRVKSQ